MIDLVKTHLTHPWGPPWTLETLGDPWRPLATMPENGHFGHFDHFQPFVLWAHFTNSHAVLRGSSEILKNPYFGNISTIFT